MANQDQKIDVGPEDPNQSKARVDLDTILVNEIGQFGRFQLRTLLLTALITVFVGFSAMEYLFTTARTPTRCLIPECDNDSPEYAPSWILNAVPGTSQSSFDNCQRFSSISASSQAPSDTCPSTLFDKDTVVSCEQYVYGNTNSIVYDFELACDEWRRTFIGTMRALGTMIALPITGYISDRWGRRVALTFNAVNTAWLGAVRYFANTYLGFIMSETVEAIFGSGTYTCVYILMLELVGPKFRVVTGVTLSNCFALAQMSVGLIAWGVPNWKNLTLTLYVPQFLSISYYWIYTESVRWYMSKGRFDESEALLKKVARVNRRSLSNKSLEALRHTAEEQLIKSKSINSNQGSKEPWLIVQVFRHRRILIRCLISPVWWITNTFIFYGLSINSVNMSGNGYLNYVAVAAIEIPGYWTAFYLMNKFGRKCVLTGGYWLCAVCQIAYIFIPQDHFAASLAVYLIAKCTIAGVGTAVYIYTAELYPTRYRHSLFAYSSMLGRIGSIVAPLTPAFGAQWFDELPFVLFAFFAILSGILTFFTPETLGTKLPDTFEQAEQIGLNSDTKT